MVPRLISRTQAFTVLAGLSTILDFHSAYVASWMRLTSEIKKLFFRICVLDYVAVRRILWDGVSWRSHHR